MTEQYPSFRLTDWLKGFDFEPIDKQERKKWTNPYIPYFPESENEYIDVQSVARCIPSDKFNVALMFAIVCNYLEVTKEQVQGRCRKKEFVFARHVIHYFAKTNTHLSLTQIGNLTRKDHATVLHSMRAIEELLIYEETRNTILALERIICPGRKSIVVKYLQEKQIKKLPAMRQFTELVNGSIYIPPAPVKSKFSKYSFQGNDRN